MQAADSSPAPPIDMNYLQDMTGGDPSFLRELFETFLNDISSRLPQLESAMNPFNGKRAYQLVHMFVGTATCLGAAQLYQSALKFEKDAASLNLSESQKSYLDFRAELLRVEAFCKDQLGRLEQI